VKRVIALAIVLSLAAGGKASGQTAAIHEVQGSGSKSPLEGETVTVQGVVIADFQERDELGGFFLQDPRGDGDEATSDGIFVFGGRVDVASGDEVRVTGSVKEHHGLTEITDVESIEVLGKGMLPKPALVHLPLAGPAEWERHEGMLLTVSDANRELIVTETYHLGRGGLVTLADERLVQYTEVNEPSVEGYREHQGDVARRTLLLDDGSLEQNPDPIVYSTRGQELTARQTLRIGDTVPSVTGVLSYGFSGWSGTEAYRLHPTRPVRFAAGNPRPSGPPSMAGDLRVATFNVLNYFNGDGRGGGFPTSRGAENVFELQRQTDKLLSAMLVLNAEVMALIEIENDPAGSDSAVAGLVDALNRRTMPGTYDHVATGRIGTDEIKVALVYRPSAIVPVGRHRILNSSVSSEGHTIDPRFDDRFNRPALAQTFAERATGERFTLIVNHLKSKGGGCENLGDRDLEDGQGNCNGVRTAAARALLDWADTVATEAGDPDVMIVGDLNAYSKEDPIRVLLQGGLRHLLAPGSYSYVFFGQSGTLDHALATPSLAAQVTAAVSWDINADEPPILDYNTNYKSPRQVELLYSESPFRSSDHDPVVIGLELGSEPMGSRSSRGRQAGCGDEAACPSLALSR
jgi:predicted extracellular nuclease